MFQRKTDTAFVERSGSTVRDYLVEWHSRWVRRFGFDGFRCDTAEFVELESWRALKQAGVEALAAWKDEHSDQALDDAPFWMVAEVVTPGPAPAGYGTEGGFDSIIEVDFQDTVEDILQDHADLAEGADALDALYSSVANMIESGETGALSYVSSHATYLMYERLAEDPAMQRHAGTALLLAPGGVTVLYGDESGRRPGPALSDLAQATRSDMNFDSVDRSILEHWQRLARFRSRHSALGGGAHQRIESPAGTYAFARTGGADVVVVLLAPAS